MSYTVQRLKDYPAILISYHDDFDISSDYALSTKDAMKLLDAESNPVTIIIDLTEFSMSLNDLLEGTRLAFKPDMNTAKHSKTLNTIVISKMGIMKKSVDGFRKMGLSDDLRVADSLEDALALL